MKSLHFNFPGQSYERFTYPAGEVQIRLTPDNAKLVREADEITVSAYLRSSADVFEFSLFGDAIRGASYGVAIWSLQLPYMPYARADRRFTPGDCHGLRCFASVVNSLGFGDVVTVDAHSVESSQRIMHLRDLSPQMFIERSIVDFSRLTGKKQITVLFPDDGARKRYVIPDSIDGNQGRVSIQVLNASKKRDPQTGKFLGFEVPDKNEFQSTAVLIPDDICDGGGTFLGIAALVPPECCLGLYVTHGIFSKGLDVLASRFSRIYTTDSFQGPRRPPFTTEYSWRDAL